MPQASGSNRSASTIAMLVGLIGIASGLLLPLEERFLSWLLTMAALVVITAAIGRRVTGVWRGALIDERNRISLTRLQMFVWLVLVLAAIVVAVASNARMGEMNPLNITIPQALWMLMGVGTTTMVAAPLIRGTKIAEPANVEEAMQAVRQVLQLRGIAGDSGRVGTVGRIVVNRSAADARWSDMFLGEEIGDVTNLSIAKIQLFYFTLILAVAYAASLGALFQRMDAVTALPAIDNGMLTLLGISNLGQLTNKAIPHSLPPGQDLS